MRNIYKILTEKYETVESVVNRRTDFIEDMEVEGKMYTVEAGFNWEDEAVSHRASIGSAGVAGRDVSTYMPQSVAWIKIDDDNGKVTDSTVIEMISDMVLDKGREEARFNT
jgi:hypothetical protein